MAVFVFKGETYRNMTELESALGVRETAVIFRRASDIERELSRDEWIALDSYDRFARHKGAALQCPGVGARAKRLQRLDTLASRLAMFKRAKRAREADTPRPLKPGDRVILSGSATSGWADRLPRGRAMIVMACDCGMCRRGSQVAVNVPHSDEMRELYPDIGPWRHLGVSGLRRRGEASKAAAAQWATAISEQSLGQPICQRDADDATVPVMIDHVYDMALFDSLGGVVDNDH